MARMRLEIGGKYNRDIVLRGNRRFLPARIRAVLSAYFTQWNTLRDISQLPRLKEDLGAVNAERHFLGTDWAALEQLFSEHQQRFSVVLSGSVPMNSAEFGLVSVSVTVSPAGSASEVTTI